MTHERDNLQRQSAGDLHNACPKLQQPDAENALPEFTAETTDVKLLQMTSDTVNATLDALDLCPTVFYNFLFSIATVINTSFTCPYEAVQTCSRWRVCLWQGLIIVIFYFCVAALLMNAVGLSFISAILIPFFSLAIWLLCYGYTWNEFDTTLSL